MKTSGIFSKALTPLFENIEKLSKIQRILISGGAFLILFGFFIYFSFLPKFNDIKTLKESIDNLEQQVAVAKRKAGQLDKFREKLKQAELEFKIAKKALPEKKEIPSLLTSISRSGKDANLEFLLFQPEAEQKKDFYAEIPVSIQVIGGYHDIALFFDMVSRLFRIVNISDINIASRQEGGPLSTSCKAVTYMFIEETPK